MTSTVRAKKSVAGNSAQSGKFNPGKFKIKVGRSKTGLGLFAGEDIPKNACIIEYVGRVIKGEEEYTSTSKYLYEVHSRKTIDGRARTNIARYANHSCRPNAVDEVRKGRVFIMSKRDIKAGEEICYDYGKDYWNEHIKKNGCRCDKCAEKRGDTRTLKVKRRHRRP